MGGAVFDVLGSSAAGQFDFGDLGCVKQPGEHSKETGSEKVLSFKLEFFTTIYYLDVTCGPNGEGKEIAVGFDYSESDFAPLYKVCFDEARANAIYAVNIIPRETANRDTSNDRPSWK